MPVKQGEILFAAWCFTLWDRQGFNH